MFLLDTNALLSQLLYPSRLGRQTLRNLGNSENVFFSSVSIAEISIKQLIKKLTFAPSILNLARESELQELPFGINAAVEVAAFSSLVGHDPFDRMIVATASSSKLNLVTSDRVMLNLGLPWIQDSFR
jgi:PIN domain nuclease of toxin-antitoxin system